MYLNEALRGIGQPKLVLYGEIAGLAITAILLFLLLKPFGVLGASISVLVGDILAFILVLALASRYTGIAWLVLLKPDIRQVYQVIQVQASTLWAKWSNH